MHANLVYIHKRWTIFWIYDINDSLCISFIASSNGIAQSNYDMMDSFQNAPVNKRSGKYDSTEHWGVDWLSDWSFMELRRLSDISVISRLGSRRPISDTASMRKELEPRASCSVNQQLNNYITTAPENYNILI